MTIVNQNKRNLPHRMVQEDECCVHVQVKLLCTRPPQQSGQWLHTESTFPGCLVFHWSERHERFYNYGAGLYCLELNNSWHKSYKANGLFWMWSVMDILDTACLSYVSFSFICFSCLTPCIWQKQRSLAPHTCNAYTTKKWQPCVSRIAQTLFIGVAGIW